MFKLIKLTLFLAVLLGGVYLMLGIQFGDKTLYEHLSGISKTDEAETLKSEIGKKIDGAKQDLKKKASSLALEELDEMRGEKTAKGSTGSSGEPSDADPKALSAVISKKNLEAGETVDRAALDRLIRRKERQHP
jgi:hypothetical protein